MNEIDDEQAQLYQEALIQQGLDKVKNSHIGRLRKRGTCHNCFDPLDQGQDFFCDQYCEDDFLARERNHTGE